MTFNRWLATEAHRRGLSIGLKNAPDLAPALLDDFDWALTEDCFDQGWCRQMDIFIAAGKPVLAAEYTDTGMTLATLCPQAKSAKIQRNPQRPQFDRAARGLSSPLTRTVFALPSPLTTLSLSTVANHRHITVETARICPHPADPLH